MKITKEIRNNKGITMVSLILTIVLMIIISSVTIHTSLDRFEINKYNKMVNDIELLEDKVNNYYLKYNGLPILRDTQNNSIKYTYSTLDFNKNSNDNDNYYILDLKAMEGISLNYGKDGFENPNTSDDVYIINEKSLTIYYVRGIKVQDVMHYTIQNNKEIEDTIPPSKPEIKVVSGIKNEEGTYESIVKVEFVPGRDFENMMSKTEVSLDNGNTWKDISTFENNMYTLSQKGTYTLKIRSLDDKGNESSNTLENIIINFISVSEAKSQNKIFEKITYLTDDYGNRIVVPKGFKIAQDSGTNIKDGVVIEDANYINTLGSQFVWVPCGEVYTDASLSTVSIPLGRYDFDENGIESICNRTSIEETKLSHETSEYINKVAYNINEFLKSVDKNGGYYFGRYEAGVENGQLDITEFSDNTAPNSNWSGYSTGNLVFKDNATVWNYTTQNKASELSINMYKDALDIRSDLVNSYAWDTAILYIQKMGNTNYSRTRIKNAVDEACKINDMAAENYEWTTETSTNVGKPCIRRGGASGYSGSYTSAYYSDSINFTTANISFRGIIYIK